MTDRPKSGIMADGCASPPCLAHQIDPASVDPLAVDPQQATDVVRWRTAERARLRAARLALTVEVRGEVARAIARHLDALTASRFGDVAGRIVSGYWPIKGEPDLRPWLTALHARGAVLALPVVEIRAAPLVFRRWQPGDRLERGHWNIPVPPAGAERIRPDITLAPLLGWDGAGYRLGYGGGYFDRTLAATSPRSFVIGIGFQAARLRTIFPQPHDIAMDAILTEAGTQWAAAEP